MLALKSIPPSFGYHIRIHWEAQLMLPDGIKPQTSLFPSAIRGCVSVAISGTLGVDHDEMKENWECGRKQADIPGSHEEKKKKKQFAGREIFLGQTLQDVYLCMTKSHVKCQSV